MGYDLLANLFKKTAITEMTHIEKLAERILFLKGDVEMKVASEVQKIHTVEDMLKLAAKMEEDSAKEYNVWANECAANADSNTKQLFESLVTDEEVHFDQYDTELENLKKFGANYLALQSIERSKGRDSGNVG
jgi:bacterioferritin